MRMLNANMKRLYGLEQGQRGLIFRGRLAAIGHFGWVSAARHGELEKVTFPNDLDFIDIVDNKNVFRVVWPITRGDGRFYELNNCTVTSCKDACWITPRNGGIMAEHLTFVFEDYKERKCLE